MGKKNENALERTKINFRANKYYVDNAPENVSQIVSGRDFVAWGENNHYADFLHDLYLNSTSLSTLINGTTDFVCGNNIKVNKQQEKIEELFKLITKSYLIYGVAYINVLRNVFNQIVELKFIDVRDIRMNENQDVFFYSKDFTKSKWGRIKTLVLPKYDENNDVKSSIFVIKDYSREIYPYPIYNSAINSIITEVEISKFHLNEIKNGFNPSLLFNFNSGTPTDEVMDELEQKINEKFVGTENVNKFLLCFNNNKESETTITKIDVDNFADKYSALEKSVRQTIFSSFGANQNLFGINNEGLNFGTEEFEKSFALYNRTRVQPLRKFIIDKFNKLGFSINIEPFTITENKEEITN